MRMSHVLLETFLMTSKFSLINGQQSRRDKTKKLQSQYNSEKVDIINLHNKYIVSFINSLRY